MTLEKRIYITDNLTPLEHRISQYILIHKEEVLHLSIQELEQKIYCSKSAIHRFCKKIGCNGFNDLKVQLSQDLLCPEIIEQDVNVPFMKTDSVQEIAQKLMGLSQTTIEDTRKCIEYDTLEIVSKILYKSSVVDIYTHAHNANIAQNFQDKMLSIGRNVQCPSSFYEQRLHALASDKTHVALFLSYSGKASFILPLVKKLSEKQVPMILISKAGNISYAPYIQYHLSLSDKEELRNRISQFSSHIAMQYMMDVLFASTYNLNREANQKYLSSSIEFMDDRTL